MEPTDIEMLRECFKDVRTHNGVGTITNLQMSTDFSALLVTVMLMPEQREVVARMSFPDVTIVCFPEVNDLVTVCMVEGDQDQTYVTGRFNSLEELIPLFARTGDTTVYARPGKNLWLGSSTKIALVRPDTATTDPLVLGTVLLNALTALANSLLQPGGTPGNPIGQSAAGPVFLDPVVRAALTSFLSTYVTTTSTNVCSQIAYTQR